MKVCAEAQEIPFFCFFVFFFLDYSDPTEMYDTMRKLLAAATPDHRRPESVPG